jgi:hypothetical protein
MAESQLFGPGQRIQWSIPAHCIEVLDELKSAYGAGPFHIISARYFSEAEKKEHGITSGQLLTIMDVNTKQVGRDINSSFFAKA